MDIAETTPLPHRPDPELFEDPAQPHRVKRDGARDLSFRGWRIGCGSHGGGVGRGVEVAVYLTTGGRIITAVKRWTSWQGEHDCYTAAAHRTAAAALAWLCDDASGQLGRASKEAWEEACDGGLLDGLDVEHVD
jgi:hypothetical protein